MFNSLSNDGLPPRNDSGSHLHRQPVTVMQDETPTTAVRAPEAAEAEAEADETSERGEAHPATVSPDSLPFDGDGVVVVAPAACGDRCDVDAAPSDCVATTKQAVVDANDDRGTGGNSSSSGGSGSGVDRPRSGGGPREGIEMDSPRAAAAEGDADADAAPHGGANVGGSDAHAPASSPSLDELRPRALTFATPGTASASAPVDIAADDDDAATTVPEDNGRPAKKRPSPSPISTLLQDDDDDDDDDEAAAGKSDQKRFKAGLQQADVVVETAAAVVVVVVTQPESGASSLLSSTTSTLQLLLPGCTPTAVQGRGPAMVSIDMDHSDGGGEMESDVAVDLTDEPSGPPEETVAPLDTPKAMEEGCVRKKASSSFAIVLSSDDDNDDDDDDIFGELSPFAQQAQDRREKALGGHESDADKALQKLLFTLGFGDTLYPHQCMAVRRAAGVPADFPLHKGSFASLKGNMSIRGAIKGIDLESIERGLLIADEMGLGKTIESIAGAIIFDALAEIASGGEQLPTVIVTPNTAVLEQWIQALRRNGVRSQRIHRFEKGVQLGGGIANRNDFLLMEKSKLQSEMKSIFDGIVTKAYTPRSSSLFPNISYQGLRELHLHERVSKGKEKVDVLDRREDKLGKKENFDDCLRRSFSDLIELEKMKQKRAFRTCIIDEAHFLKNNLAFWGIATLLLGAHSQRVIPLTGTPYNNRTADIAAIMAYIDPGLEYAYTDFWEKATSLRAHKEVRHQLQGWTQDFLVRRTKESVLAGVLRAKKVERSTVQQHPDEIATQQAYEVAIQNALTNFSRLVEGTNNNPVAMAQKKRVFTILMCLISCARGAAIHPMIPCGREFTIQFSPTRKNLSQVDRKTCVLCHQGSRPSMPLDKVNYDGKQGEGPKVVSEGKKTESNEVTVAKTVPTKMKEKEADKKKRKKNRVPIDLDLDNEEIDDDEFDVATGVQEESEEGEDAPLIALQCCDEAFGVQHYAHETCVAEMECLGCPRCQDGRNRMMLNTRDSNSSGFQSPMYCQEIVGGFKGSSKINEIVKAVKEISADDKILILSFFKSSLDLLEGIFVHDLKIGCARFDGDFSSQIANEQLERFKRSPATRILLATVQSGGTGLNIVAANHVLFVDRWYNPFVHAQAMDRCYRIGQKKDVFVRFFDCGRSVDDVMAILNKYKQQNSTVILSDGTELGANSGGSLSFQEMSGLLSRAFDAVTTARNDHISEHGRNKTIPAASSDLIDAILANDLHNARTLSDHEAFMQRVHGLILQRAAATAADLTPQIPATVKNETPSKEHTPRTTAEKIPQSSGCVTAQNVG